jgi:hypothetical protein
MPGMRVGDCGKAPVERLERLGIVVARRPAATARSGLIGIFPLDSYCARSACRRPTRILTRALSQSCAGDG